MQGSKYGCSAEERMIIRYISKCNTTNKYKCRTIHKYNKDAAQQININNKDVKQ